MRTGKMEKIVAVPVCEGEITKWDKFAEEFERGEKVSDKVIGYYAMFKLRNGFVKATYWTVDEVITHAKRFSKTYSNSSSPWQTGSFDAMARKTVLLSILKIYAPLSVKMQEAIEADGTVSAINENGDVETFDVVDAEVETVEGDSVEVVTEAEPADNGQMVDVETGELFPN